LAITILHTSRERQSFLGNWSARIAGRFKTGHAIIAEAVRVGTSLLGARRTKQRRLPGEIAIVYIKCELPLERDVPRSSPGEQAAIVP
jgi:hypothetical protein